MQDHLCWKNLITLHDPITRFNTTFNAKVVILLWQETGLKSLLYTVEWHLSLPVLLIMKFSDRDY